MRAWPWCSERISCWLLVSAAAISSPTARAQGIAEADRALSAFNSGNEDTAVEALHELAEDSRDPVARATAEHYLGQVFSKKGLWAAAMVYQSATLKAGQAHPFHQGAVKALVELQQRLEDEFLVPNLLSAAYAAEWRALPPEILAKVHYLVAGISQRKGKLQEARAFLESVPRESPVYAKSRYLLGVVLIDPAYPAGPQVGPALRAFQDVLATQDENQLDLPRTQQLATLGLGRAYYGVREYSKSVEAYERIPRFSPFWDQALFENGFARFQNDDAGGALGSLQALHAPQFEGAFQPESWVLKATVYYFNCLYDETKSSLNAFDRRYLPMAESLKSVTGMEETDPSEVLKLIADGSPRIPRPVLLWVRGNERMSGALRVLSEIDRELSVVRNNSRWMSGKLGPDLVNSLGQARTTMAQVAGQFARNRLNEAARNIKAFSDQAEIIRFETTKAEKEMAEAAIDQSAILARQALHRPVSPADDWNYWKFDGEFWLDEIGYYQYTLKNGCPTKP